jgi:hypothetical protein
VVRRDPRAGRRAGAPSPSPTDRPRCQWLGIRCDARGRTEIVRDSRPWGVGRTGPGSRLGTGGVVPCPHPPTPHTGAGRPARGSRRPSLT